MKFQHFMSLVFLSVFALLYYYHWTVRIPNEDPTSKWNQPAILSATRSFAQESQTTDPEERQRARKSNLQEYCVKHPYNEKPEPAELRFIVVDDEHKFMYCTVPKVATTQWKNVLVDLRGIRPLTGKFNVHRWNLWKRLHQYTEEEREHRFKTYFKFLFVREPLGRLLSAYKDKFVSGNRYYTRRLREQMLKQYRPEDFSKHGNNSVKFSEFVQYFSTDGPRNQHWRQYEKLCHPCVIKYDLIGHLETLEEDATLLLKKAGIDDRVTFPQVHAATNSSKVLQYYSQVPLEHVARLGEVYRKDFEMFGYDYLGPLKSLLNGSLTFQKERTKGKKGIVRTLK